jgi:non-heme chloroperoxidase
MNFIPVNSKTSLFYREWGTGTPVLFVNSWGVNSDLWQYQMFYLASRGFRVITYDRRGHGRSSDPGGGYDFDTLADDLAAVIHHLDLREVDVVSHSMGAGELVRYISRHGASRIHRTVFVAPTTPFALRTPDNPAGIDAAYFDGIRAALAADFPGWLAANARPFFRPETSQAMVDWGLGLFGGTSLQAAIECNRALTQTDFRRELSNIAVPALVIHGDHDASAPLELTGRRTAALIPASRLLIYEGGPHGLMFTHMDRLNADLLSFLKP